MKKLFVVVPVVLLFTLAAAAQDVPTYETFLGYTYVRANSATNIPAFSANGGSAQFAYNFNKWISGVVDLGAVHNGSIGGLAIDDTTTNFLAGPRVSFRYSRLRPYFQVLWGGVYMAASTQVDITPLVPTPPIFLPGEKPGQFPVTGRAIISQTAFAMTAGGGLDVKINKWVSFRPIGLDYFLTRLQNFRTANDNSQNNLRYTTGINFTLGAR